MVKKNIDYTLFPSAAGLTSGAFGWRGKRRLKLRVMEPKLQALQLKLQSVRVKL